jgi:hypothetical protein
MYSTKNQIIHVQEMRKDSTYISMTGELVSSLCMFKVQSYLITENAEGIVITDYSTQEIGN